jgi:hypothetical protein
MWQLAFVACVCALPETRERTGQGSAVHAWRKKQWYLLPYDCLLARMIAALSFVSCALVRVASAQTTEDGISPASVVVAAVLGAAASIVLVSLVVSLVKKWYKMRQEAPFHKRDAVTDSLKSMAGAGLIPIGDIAIEAAYLYRLLHNDDVETTPTAIENNERKRCAVPFNSSNFLNCSFAPGFFRRLLLGTGCALRSEHSKSGSYAASHHASELPPCFWPH